MKRSLNRWLIAACAVLTTAALAPAAHACPVYRTESQPDLPAFDQRVVFTATLEEAQSSLPQGLTASLRVRSRLLGRTDDLVVIRRSGFVVSETPVSETEVEIVTTDCITYLFYEDALRSLQPGSEVAVMARKTGGNSVRVLDLAPLNSVHGRELLALANP